MKITMNVECTPEEARAFLAQPDIKPLQDKLMQEMRNRLMVGIAARDPAEILPLLDDRIGSVRTDAGLFTRMSGGKRDK